MSAELVAPHMVELDLTELQNNGVLMAANERFFWPLGLALAWEHDPENGDTASRLHVREWQYADGHQETIEISPDDEIGPLRRERFMSWLADRVALIIPAERAKAERIRDGGWR
jgi:hypothetical protein